ncbi:MAG: hypothetical protein R3C02_13630 [Planctomycetaceae bacterium]
MNSLNSASDDLINQLIAYEEGDLSETDTIALFQQLIDDGSVWKLQGHYGRMAHQLIGAGLCTFGPTVQQDYYGNPIPGRDDVSTSESSVF